jgi:hypothetical protein
VLEDGAATVPDLILGIAYLDHEEGDEGVGLDVVQRERFAALAAPLGKQLEDQGQILQALDDLFRIRNFLGVQIQIHQFSQIRITIVPFYTLCIYLSKQPKHAYIFGFKTGQES